VARGGLSGRNLNRAPADRVRNMQMKYAACVLAAMLVAGCSKGAPEPQPSSKLPNTCGRDMFAATVRAFDDIAFERDQVLARIEALSIGEPAEYVRRWDQEKANLRQLAAKAEQVGLPRCLANAKELFLHYLEKTQAAVDLRAPSADFIDYRRERETADSIYAQYEAEVRLQEKNRP
jgi:hypothetical protein